MKCQKIQYIMQIYSHRAGRGLGPENTLFACQASLRHPIDFIDFDVAMTKDGELVITHDPELNPDITRDSTGAFIQHGVLVSSLNYAELSAYNVGEINPHSAYASYFPHQKKVAFAPIPLLKEGIEYVHSHNPNVKFQIEIKTDPQRPELTPPYEALTEALVDLLTEMSLIEVSEIQAFDYRCLLHVHTINPHIKTTFLTHPAEDNWACPLWTAGYDIGDFDHSIIKMIKSLGGSCWAPYQMDVTQQYIDEAHSLGLKIVPWGFPEREGTEFNTDQIKRLMEWGVDGVITDRPDKAFNIKGM